VIDTGVLVSAFVFGGTPPKAVKKAFDEADFFVSLALLKEYRDVPLELHQEGKIDSRQLKALISGIATVVSGATVVVPKKNLPFVETLKTTWSLSAVRPLMPTSC
jgi:predicted nucleic acid-binding protein